MHPHLKYLIDLQAVDFRLIEIRERLNRFPKGLAEVEARVAVARQQVTAAKDALTGSLKDRKTYEMDVEQWKERAKKYRNQSSEVKTNESYKALLHEIQNAENEVAKAEDRLLDRMVAGEEFDRQVKASVDGLTSLIEPLMIGIMGVLVGGIVLAVFLPILKLQSMLTGGGPK